MSPTARVEVLTGGTVETQVIPRAGLAIGGVARFFWEGDDLLVTDLGPENQVHRDGQLFDGPLLVEEGDELVFGDLVLRVSIDAAGFGYPMAVLAETEKHMAARAPSTPPTEEASIDRRAAELLPVMESFFHARSVREIGQRVVESVKQNLLCSRIALIEIEERAERFRVLGLQDAPDPSFISRTVVAEAVRRGLALHQLGAVGRPIAPSLVAARATSAIAALLRCRADRPRILYLDTLADQAAKVPPLTWRQAFEVQVIASYATGAFDALTLQKEMSEERVRFEALRRHFSPQVLGKLSGLRQPEKELASPRLTEGCVLYADLSGFTALTERWRTHPESLVSILDLWFEAGSAAIFAHGGTLDRYVGDAILALFGAPLPIADPTLAAVRCAQDLVRVARELEAKAGGGLSVTVGIETGQLLCASIGSRRRRDLMALGEPVSRSARLTQTAPPGTIVLGLRAAADVSDRLPLEDLGGMWRVV